MLTRLLSYLSAAQMESSNPQLDGDWSRGFDYRLGEPYGANGDVDIFLDATLPSEYQITDLNCYKQYQNDIVQTSYLEINQDILPRDPLRVLHL